MGVVPSMDMDVGRSVATVAVSGHGCHTKDVAPLPLFVRWPCLDTDVAPLPLLPDNV